LAAHSGTATLLQESHSAACLLLHCDNCLALQLFCCCAATILFNILSSFVLCASQVCYPSYVGLPLDAMDTSSSSSSSSSSGASYASAAAAARHGSQPDAVGVCAAHQAGLLLPRAYPTPWPTPVAYFPLSQVRDNVRYVSLCVEHRFCVQRLLPRAYPTPWPTPVAYYPLSQVGQVLVAH
jgi:hypothetical protein